MYYNSVTISKHDRTYRAVKKWDDHISDKWVTVKNSDGAKKKRFNGDKAKNVTISIFEWNRLLAFRFVYTEWFTNRVHPLFSLC